MLAAEKAASVDAKAYLRQEYWKYWIDARDTSHKVTPYDTNLIELARGRMPPGGLVLEVAVGTGYPFAASFSERDVDVIGVDISPELVAACRRRYPKVACQVCDAEQLGFPDGRFAATYCFHATWIFPNVKKAIDEMLRVTRPGGWVIFDTQNRNNPRIARDHRRHVRDTRGVWKLVRFGRQIVKVVLRRGVPDWHTVAHLWPSDPEEIWRHLHRRSVAGVALMGRNADDSLERLGGPGPYPEYARLVFLVSMA